MLSVVAAQVKIMKLPLSLKKSSTTALLTLSSIFAAVSFSACYNDLNGAKLLIQVNPQAHSATLKQIKGAEVLTWQGQMKNDVHFGEPVRLFWEIDPQTINCIDEAGRDQQCLKVRHVSYDERGIKLGSGAWRTFYGKIHGYEHRPDRRQIIRLNAYNNPDGDENPYYVYDMAIETHAVDQGGL